MWPHSYWVATFWVDSYWVSASATPPSGGEGEREAGLGQMVTFSDKPELGGGSW